MGNGLDWHVTPDGDALGDGSIEFPWNMQTALAATYLQPGSTLWIHGGQYDIDFSPRMLVTSPTESDPFTIRAIPGERVVINGEANFSSGLQYLHVIDLEFCYLDWLTRDNPGITKQFIFSSPNSKLINCLIHDMSNVLFSSQATGSEWQGCVVWGNGWDEPDRGHGHALYIQGELPETKSIKDCVFLSGFGFALHGYSEAGNLGGIHLERSIFCYGRCLLGGSAPVLDARLNECHLLTNVLQLGFAYGNKPEENQPQDITIADSTLALGWWVFPFDPFYSSWNITDDNNITDISSLDAVYLYPVGDERAHMVIYNAAELNTVTVDLSSLGWQSGNVKARNAADYFADVQELAIANGEIQIAMNNRTVYQPIGHTGSPHAPGLSLHESTFPAFGCFVLELA